MYVNADVRGNYSLVDTNRNSNANNGFGRQQQTNRNQYTNQPQQNATVYNQQQNQQQQYAPYMQPFMPQFASPYHYPYLLQPQMFPMQAQATMSTQETGKKEEQQNNNNLNG